MKAKARGLSLSSVYGNAVSSFKDKGMISILIIAIVVIALILAPQQILINKLHYSLSYLYAHLNNPSLFMNKSISISIITNVTNSSYKYLYIGGILIPTYSALTYVLKPLALSPLTSVEYLLVCIILAFIAVLVFNYLKYGKTFYVTACINGYINLILGSIIFAIVTLPPLALMLLGFGTSLLSMPLGIFIAVVGFLILLYTLVRLSLFPVYVVFKGPLNGIRESLAKTSGKFWFIFGTLFVPLLLIVFILSLVFSAFVLALPEIAFLIQAIGISIIIIVLSIIEYNYAMRFLSIND
ncbi:MAG: hypothetical protein OH318_00900 [Candidatus Parvarchaeota archaeon]|nr:hypothetical protein [Candidatus Rehaiarchaeum fermentans]